MTVDYSRSIFTPNALRVTANYLSAYSIHSPNIFQISSSSLKTAISAFVGATTCALRMFKDFRNE